MKRIVLAGGGHAHLTVIRMLLDNKRNDIEVILISPSTYQYYSGMFSGYTEGLYQENDIRIDLSKLAEFSSISFYEDEIIKVDPDKKMAYGLSGQQWSFDILSFNIGSLYTNKHTSNQIIDVKPNFLFTKNIEQFRSLEKPVIVGGGASGVELALSIHAWKRKHQPGSQVRLISSQPLLHSYGERTSNQIRKIASQKGLTFTENEKVIQQQADFLVTDHQRQIPYSGILWLTGPTAANVFNHSQLETDHRGFLLVNDFLQSKRYSNIFAVGDCSTLINHPALPKNGVYAVRQGPILAHNISALLEDKSFTPFKPQSRFLAILSTGDQEALLTYGHFSTHGKFPWRLKNHIDRTFMNKTKGTLG
jgi:NADH dehydrogenase FAD-containing subunit